MVDKQFDEAMVDKVHGVVAGQGLVTPCFVVRAVLTALSQTHAIVAKDEYELLVARLEHFRGALTREERIAHTLAESLAQTLRDNQALREKEAAPHV